jgi:hypothetical protein
MFDDDEGDIGFVGVEDQNTEVGPPAKYLKTAEESQMTTNGNGEGAECEQAESECDSIGPRLHFLDPGDTAPSEVFVEPGAPPGGSSCEGQSV